MSQRSMWVKIRLMNLLKKTFKNDVSILGGLGVHSFSFKNEMTTPCVLHQGNFSFYFKLALHSIVVSEL